MATGFLKKLILPGLALSSFFTGAAAAASNTYGSLGPMPDMTSVFSVVLGVTTNATSEVLLLKFIMLLILMALFGFLLTGDKLGIFKSNKGIGAIIAILISFIAVRYIPQDTVTIFAGTMGASVAVISVLAIPVGIMIVTWNFIKGSTNKWRYMGIATIAAGLIEIVGTSTSFGIGNFFGSASLFATIVGIILAIVGGIMIFAGGNPFRNLMDAFRESGAIERDVKKELKDSYKESQIDAKGEAVSRLIINNLINMRNAMVAGNWQKASSYIAPVKTGITETLDLLKTKRKFLLDNQRRAQDAIPRAKKEGHDTSSLDSHIIQVENSVQKIDTWLGKLENYNQALLSNEYVELAQLATALQQKNFSVANTLIQTLIQQTEKIEQDELLSNRELQVLNNLLKTGLKETFDERITEKQSLIEQNGFAQIVAFIKKAETDLGKVNTVGMDQEGKILLNQAKGAQTDAIAAIKKAQIAPMNLKIVETERAIKDIRFAINEISKVLKKSNKKGTERLYEEDEIKEMKEALIKAEQVLAEEKAELPKLKQK